MPNDHPTEHPGTYIRNVLIPKDMTVTHAARILGVGRPALSNLLNGNADLSQGMAAKLEKAFGADADDLLARQSEFDAATRPAASAATARTLVPPFAAPKANDIEAWATEMKARATLAALLRRLVHSTCDDLRKVDFPAHDDSQRRGWDGEVETDAGNPWIPAGASGWEFGTNENIKTKADRDFAARVKAVPEARRLGMVFIFVTPRRWPGKKQWAEARAAEKHWKDVRAFDSSDLEQWMEQSIPGQVWFAYERGWESKVRGTRSLARCWKRWNADCDPAFTSRIFDEALAASGEKLLAHLRGPARTPLVIAADSVLEGLAFVYAALHGDDPERAAICDRVVVFFEKGPLTELANPAARFIPVTTDHDTEVELSETGAGLGGLSIVPRGMVRTKADIVIDILSGDAFRKALETMELDCDEIERLKDESGRSLTVLRRRLAPENSALRSPEWSRNDTPARSMFPFMLAGAWKNDNENDQEVLCLLAGRDNYPEVETKFQGLLGTEDAPVWSVGSFRGVVSQIDALYAVARQVMASDLKRFYEVAELVLSERDPALDMPAQDRWMAGLYGKIRDISPTLRKGIADSLVVLAVHGNRLFQNRLGVDTQQWADRLVRTLFERMDGDTLQSQSNELQCYAEAAPGAFLKIVERDLAKNDPALRALLQPVGNPLFSGFPSAGLFWALELLAWSPDFLWRVVDILAKIYELEPEEYRGDAAMGRLRSIFFRSAPQTSAGVVDRIVAFNRLEKEHSEVAWILGRTQYERWGSVDLSIKPKWRDYALGGNTEIREAEIWIFTKHCLERTLNWPQMNKAKLADLIARLEEIEGFDDTYRTRVWERVIGWAKDASDEDRAWLRNHIRVEISRSACRRIRNGAPLANVKAKAREARGIYDALAPDDIVWKHAWLFTVALGPSWEDIHADDRNFDARIKRRDAQREAAVKAVFAQEGTRGVTCLAVSGDAPDAVGYDLAKIVTSDAERREFISLIIAEPAFPRSEKLKILLGSFLFVLGDEKAVGLIDMLCTGLGDEQLLRLYCLCPFGRTVWDAVEASSQTVSERYWRTVSIPRLRKSEQELRHAITNLIEARRGWAALPIVHLNLKDIESEQLWVILQALPQSDASEQDGLEGEYIEDIFKVLNARGTIGRAKLAGLEYLYLQILRFSEVGIPNLEAEINDDPSLFCEVIRRAIPPEGKISKTQKRDVENAYLLLETLSSVPGTDENGVIQSEKLKAWITDARRQSDRIGHQKILDIKIGKMLAQAPPDNDGNWPCQPIREAVQELHSPDMAEGIQIGLYNKHGATVRGFGEGGVQERALARRYETWAKACGIEHSHMADILRERAKGYSTEAEERDNDATIQKRMQY